MKNFEENKKRFMELCSTIKREGINELLSWLEEQDFFEAPASTRFHGAYAGGLLQHSLNVYDRLCEQLAVTGITAEEETVKIVSLFHDICKANCYKTDFRNVKGEDGQWRKVPTYAFAEQFPFGGHGSKSVYILMKFIKLTDEEAVCINCHMGAYDRAPGDYSLTNAYEAYPLGLALHTADMYAATLDEVEK